MPPTPGIIEDLSEEEKYLWAILSDESGLDLAEFCWIDEERPDGCWRAWPYQWAWFRCVDPQQIDQCLAEGTLVLTKRGQVPIEDVQVGDMVFTHKGRWRPVTYAWDRGERAVVKVKGQGHPGLIVTNDHKFWIDNEWKVPGVGDRWQTPWHFPAAEIPPLPARTYAPGRPCNVPHDVNDPEFLWLFGLFVAEGSCSSSFGKGGTVNRTTFSVHEREVEEIERRLEKVGLRFNTHRVGTEKCFNIVINSRPLATWMSEHGGRGARNKHLATWVFGLEDGQRRAVLNGLAYGDGYERSSHKIEYTTTSKALAVDVKLLAAVCGYFTTMTSYEGRTNFIEGRPIIGGAGFVVGWHMKGRHPHVKSIEAAGSVRVFDIEVADDHSFVAEGIIVSNCARSVGKSLSIKLRGFAFPFVHPGQEMVITAPELNHLEPITDLIENQFYSCRLGRYMLQTGRSGVTHRPFKMNFRNGARMFGRIPQKDGKGVKGIHPIWLELDEAQDFPEPAWKELFETVKQGFSIPPVWRAHGVTKGVRDKFYEYTTKGVEEGQWKVHQFCLPGDTLVYGTAGPIPIAEIEPGTEVWTITRNGELSCDIASARIANGVKRLWKVHAKGGFDLRSTGNHPYLILSRAGTRRKRRELRFEWVEAENLRSGDYLIAVDGLPGTGNRFPTVDEITVSLSSKSPFRSVPEWIWEASAQMQLAFLHGYLVGDGSLSRQQRGQDPWQIGTASLVMAKELRALCHYLGLRCSSMSTVAGGDLGNGPQYRFYVYPDKSWFSQVPKGYSQVRDGQMLQGLGKNFVARRIDSVTATDEFVETFDITVGDDHNFIAEGIVVHNTAMHRPVWTDDERQKKIALYHGREDPDYKRNVLGQHGDATSPIFVLHRLMACVDDDTESSYNTDEYTHFEITDNWLESAGTTIEQELDLPAYHTDRYKTFWVGMDVGWTNHPSEIAIFAEERMTKEEYNFYKKNETMGRRKAVPPLIDLPRLKLVCRVTLSRIGSPDQKAAIMKIIEHYRPKAFSFDATGAGLPMFQDIQAELQSKDWSFVKTVVKGYNFSGNILVDFDQTIDVDEFATKEDIIKETGIKRNTVEYATDKLRYLIDNGRFWLPWEKDLLGEFEGQTYKITKTALNSYGKREYSLGKFHFLDACRMMALGWAQYAIEEFVKRDDQEPILDLFVGV